MCLICVHVWASTAWLWLLTLAQWQPQHSAILMGGSPAPTYLPPLFFLKRMVINNSKWSQSHPPLRLLAVNAGWADITAAWKATDRQKAEWRKMWCTTKRLPCGFYQLSWGEINILLWDNRVKQIPVLKKCVFQLVSNLENDIHLFYWWCTWKESILTVLFSLIPLIS